VYTAAIGWLNQSYWTSNEFVQVQGPAAQTVWNVRNCQASAAVQIRPAVFWDFMQHRIALCYRRFGTTYWPCLQGSGGPRRMPEHLGTQCVTRVYPLPPLTHHTALRRLAKGFILKYTLRLHLDIIKISHILHFICIRTGLILSCSLLLVFLYFSKTYFNFALSYSFFSVVKWRRVWWVGYVVLVWQNIYISKGFGRQPWKTENTWKTCE